MSFALLLFDDFSLFLCCKGFIVIEAWNIAFFIDDDPFSMSFSGNSHSLYDCLGLNMTTFIRTLAVNLIKGYYSFEKSKSYVIS